MNEVLHQQLYFGDCAYFPHLFTSFSLEYSHVWKLTFYVYFLSFKQQCICSFFEKRSRIQSIEEKKIHAVCFFSNYKVKNQKNSQKIQFGWFFFRFWCEKTFEFLLDLIKSPQCHDYGVGLLPAYFLYETPVVSIVICIFMELTGMLRCCCI